MGYTELQVTTNFSFLRGGSHPEEMVEHAAELGYTSIAITDHNTLAGIVRAHAAARGKNIRIIPGCCLNLLDAPSLLALPISKGGYANLSALLTEGNLRTEKGKCELYKADVFRYSKDIKFIVVPPVGLDENFDFTPSFKTSLGTYNKALSGNLYLGATRSFQGEDGKRLFRLSRLSERFNIPMVATNDVHYHDHARRELQTYLPASVRNAPSTTQGSSFTKMPNVILNLPRRWSASSGFIPKPYNVRKK